MQITTSYKIRLKHCSRILDTTFRMYNRAVDFFIMVCLTEWDMISSVCDAKHKVNCVESLTVTSKRRPAVPYDFGKELYKFPSYLRRAAINAAIGKVLSYKSSLAAWEKNKSGDEPGFPHAGNDMPCMYNGNCFIRTGMYTARIKVFIRNTWDWLDVSFKKSDADYISRKCTGRVQSAPVLQKCGKHWALRFTFTEQHELQDTNICSQTVLSVDLGINSACAMSIMSADGTVAARKVLHLGKENDCLRHALGRIRKAQRLCAKKMPRLWASADGINDSIAVKTAAAIIDFAVLYNADVIVFEYLDFGGKKRGGMKQRLALWKARHVQSLVADKAHRLGIRIAHVNAWNTSRLAFDGSGRIERRGGDGNYSVCRFSTGKVYNCDLSASYNIGARYFIKYILKSLPETAVQGLAAKDPSLLKRSTCTLSTLISLYAGAGGLSAGACLS